MSGRYFGFVLLVLFPVELHAQTAAEPCRAPRLVKGFVVPEQETYSHGSKISYSCDNGHKPAVEGWWATSTCHNGTWSQPPQCIDNNACIPPVIPNAEYTATSNGWHANKDVIRTTCDKGYEHKDYAATATCINGTWSSLPVCEKREDACGTPPQYPHTVIVNQKYQELFSVDSQVQYECEHGYAIDGTRTNKSVICMGGIWTEGPQCSRQTATGSGHGGSGTAVGGAGSSGGGIHTVPVSRCGDPPRVEHAEVVETRDMFVRYQCNNFFTEVGPEEVMCFSDGRWSQLPTCESIYCSVDTDQSLKLLSVGMKFIKYGDNMELECRPNRSWLTKHYAVVQCTDGKVNIGKCCSEYNKWSC
ncbi:hypothetical protein JOB18_035540 [Solea senegalensis]|uniref:Sushi domain-containing protein n=2 Tax=Solea senegalensis TaxID=28829 RepID=A0AAV6T989_SOLSE|nr:hypothetical protein JOB18_035540 [Solea senegalensis]